MHVIQFMIVFLILNTKDFTIINQRLLTPLGLRVQPLLEEANINIKNIQPLFLSIKRAMDVELSKDYFRSS